jgi:uncharacterized protein (DUF488 family)
MAPVTFTIGYEGKKLDEFLSLLVEAGVDRVVDVRALPLSRRKGFSKTPLGGALAANGIEYVHVRAAGNPHRDIKDDSERSLALYARHIDANPDVLVAIEAAIEGRRAALLCMEADAQRCHRSIIADRLCRRDPRRIVRNL